MPYATAQDSTRLFYDVRGHGEDVLVLLAGQASNHHWWDLVRPDFDRRFRTVAFDYRGTGDSDRPDAVYSTRGFAEDVVAILDHLEVVRAHVYGTSMGGRVAQWLAVDHPDRIHRLVLGCTSPGSPHGVERDPAIDRRLADPDPEVARAVLSDLMYSPAYLAAHPGPHHTLGDPTMPAHARRRHRIASARHDSWDALPGITASTLVLHGTDDVFNPAENAPLLAERIPNARVHLFPGARHAYFEETRDQASPTVIEFLAA